MKKYILILLLLIININLFSLTKEKETKTEYETEKVTYMDNMVTLKSTYLNFCNEIRISIYVENNKNFKLDEIWCEKICREYMENWIRSEEHRYFKYIIMKRKKINKKIIDNKNCTIYDFIITLY